MFKLIVTILFALSGALSVAPVAAQASTRDQIRMIEQEYARQSNGAMIPDAQLEYYIARSNEGWSRARISADIASSRGQYSNSTNWRPQSGWVAREVVCTSIDKRYRECQAPFRGTAVITQQISQSACIKGQSWGERPGVIWVRNGCRARFGIVPDRVANDNHGDNRMIVCASNQGRYRECNTGFRGRVQLANRLNNSQACTEGRDWGQREGIVWVKNGCRAQFTSIGRRGPRDDNARYGNQFEGRNPNYAVTCSSNDNAQVRCSWDNRYGTPRLSQQLSQSACIQGRSWGLENRGYLWVSNGCRARFVSSIR